jgi:hypothetical protein
MSTSFEMSNGTFDIYGLYDPSVTNPVDYLGGDEQEPDDPEGIIEDGPEDA